MNKFRFTVFGLNSTTLVEYSTDDIDLAVQLHDWLACSDYKSRIFDNQERQFLGADVIKVILKHQ